MDGSEGFDDFLLHIRGPQASVRPLYSTRWRGQRPPGGTRRPPDAAAEELKRRRIEFSLELTKRRIYHRLEASPRGDITIEVILPEEHWEVRFSAGGHITVEKPRRTGEVLIDAEAEQVLSMLLAEHGE